jgi:hypothetical protein
MAALRWRKPTKAVGRAGRTEPGNVFPVRRPRRIQFEPPAGSKDWHMTGRINWPCPRQRDVVGPTGEWTNDEGARIWLSAQLRDLVIEFPHRTDRWRGFAVHGRKLLAGAVQRSRASAFCIALCYLHLAADAVA